MSNFRRNPQKSPSKNSLQNISCFFLLKNPLQGIEFLEVTEKKPFEYFTQSLEFLQKLLVSRSRNWMDESKQKFLERYQQIFLQESCRQIRENSNRNNCSNSSRHSSRNPSRNNSKNPSRKFYRVITKGILRGIILYLKGTSLEEPPEKSAARISGAIQQTFPKECRTGITGRISV